MKKAMKKKKKAPAKKAAPKVKKAAVKAKTKSKVAAKTKVGKKSNTVSFAELFELKKKMEADKITVTHPEGTPPPHELHREESKAEKVQPDVRNNRTNGSGSRHH